MRSTARSRSTASTAERRPIVKASVADGVMRIGRVLRWTTTYRMKSAGPPPPSLLIEQPRRAGAVLTSPDPKNVELTPQAYRIPANLPADGDGSLTVVEEQPIEETIRLLDIDDVRLGVLLSSAELDPKMKQALADLAARRREIARRKAELDRLQSQRARLIEDETRLRANLAAVGNEPGLRRIPARKIRRGRERDRENFRPLSPRRRKRSPLPNAISPPMSMH